ncbi:unnamed protein product [Sphagnum jensenii]
MHGQTKTFVTYTATPWTTTPTCYSLNDMVTLGTGSSLVTYISIYQGTLSVPLNCGNNPASTVGTYWNIVGSAANGGSGTVTSFSAGAWPSWLTPTITNPTTTPSIAVVASSIPNSALANSSTTVNGQNCTLGGSCSIAAGNYLPLTGGTLTGKLIAPSISKLPGTFSVVAEGDSRQACSAIAGSPCVFGNTTLSSASILPALNAFSQSTATTNQAVGGSNMADLVARYASSVKPLCQAATTNAPVLLFVEDGYNDLSGKSYSTSAYSIASNVITLTNSSTGMNGNAWVQVGEVISLSGYTTSTFLNGATLTVTGFTTPNGAPLTWTVTGTLSVSHANTSATESGIYALPPISGSSLYSAYLSYMTTAKTDGCTPIAMTNLPGISSATGYSAANQLFNSDVLNAQFQSGTPWSQVVNYDQLNPDPASSDYLSDEIHQSSSFQYAMAAFVNGVFGGYAAPSANATSKLYVNNPNHAPSDLYAPAGLIWTNAAGTSGLFNGNTTQMHMFGQSLFTSPLLSDSCSQYGNGSSICIGGTTPSLFFGTDGTSYFSRSGGQLTLNTPGPFSVQLATSGIAQAWGTPSAATNLTLTSSGVFTWNLGGPTNAQVFGDGSGHLQLNPTGGDVLLGTGTDCGVALCLGGNVKLAGAPSGSYLKADGTGYGTPSGGGLPSGTGIVKVTSGAGSTVPLVGTGTGGVMAAPTIQGVTGNAVVFDSAGGAADSGHPPAAIGTNGQIPVSNGTIYVPTNITTALNGLVTAGSGGVTQYQMLSTDTSNPSLWVPSAVLTCGSVVAQSTAAASATTAVWAAGQIATMIADGAVTAGDILVPSASVPGDVHDSGLRFDTTLAISGHLCGRATASATGAGVPFTAQLYSPSTYGNSLLGAGYSSTNIQKGNGAGQLTDISPITCTGQVIQSIAANGTPTCVTASGSSLPTGPGVVTVPSGSTTGAATLTQGLFAANAAMTGNENGDSIFAGVGISSGTASQFMGNQVLIGMGVSIGSITNNAISGSGINYIASRIIKNSTVTPTTISGWDGLENNTCATDEYHWQACYHEALAADVWDATIDAAYDSTGFPAKVVATAPQVTVSGSTTASTNFPTPGLTCNSGTTCTFTFPNVPGADIVVLTEVDTTGSGAGYNPTISIDSQTYPGSWTTGTWMTAYTSEIDGFTYAPWANHISVPEQTNSNSIYGGGKHTVAVTVPTGVTVIGVIGNGGDKSPTGPLEFVMGQGPWYNYNQPVTVSANNMALRGAAHEASQAGFNVMFHDPRNEWDGKASPTITWGSGCSTNPDVVITLSGGSYSSIVNNPVGSVGGGVCTGTPTMTLNGSGTGATATATCSGTTCTNYTITAGGTGYYGTQVFNTSAGHPNVNGATYAATGALAQIQALAFPRNADAGSGSLISADEHIVQTPVTAALIMPYASSNVITLGSSIATNNIDPGRFGETTKAIICQPAGQAYSFTFPSNVIINQQAGYVDTPAASTCDGFTLNRTAGLAGTANLWTGTLVTNGGGTVDPVATNVPAWLQNKGNGADGACNYTTNTAIFGEKFCTSVTISPGVVVTIGNKAGVFFHVTGNFNNNGTINARGIDGASGIGFCSSPSGAAGGGASAGNAGNPSWATAALVGTAIQTGGAGGAASGGNASNSTQISTVWQRACLNSGGGIDGQYFSGQSSTAGANSGGAVANGATNVIVVASSITGTGSINAYGQAGNPASASSTGPSGGGAGGVIILSAQTNTGTQTLSVAGGPGAISGTTYGVPEAVAEGGSCTVSPQLLMGVSAGTFTATPTIVNAGAGCGTGNGLVWRFLGGGGTQTTASVSCTWVSGACTAPVVTPGDSAGYTAATYALSGSSSQGPSGYTATYTGW